MTERFGLRKLSIGLASVLIGIGFIHGQNVQADTIDNATQAETTQNTEIIQENNTQTDDQIKQQDQKLNLHEQTSTNISIKAVKTGNVADGLSDWNTGKATDFFYMFQNNQIQD